MKRDKDQIINVCEREGEKEEEDDEIYIGFIPVTFFLHRMTQIVHTGLFLQPLWDITEVHLRILTQHSLGDSVKKIQTSSSDFIFLLMQGERTGQWN